jgi:hypothetical protein
MAAPRTPATSVTVAVTPKSSDELATQRDRFLKLYDIVGTLRCDDYSRQVSRSADRRGVRVRVRVCSVRPDVNGDGDVSVSELLSSFRCGPAAMLSVQRVLP